MRINIMNKSRKSLILVTVAVVILALLFSAFAMWQIYNYEQGVAELYAQEQDGYVEIVARQIELMTAFNINKVDLEIKDVV